MEVTIKHEQRYDKIQISGNVNIYNAYKLRDAIMKVIDSDNKIVVVDLKYVYYMDSSGIGALFVGQKKMAAMNGLFALININDEILSILKQSQLDKYFSIYNSEEEIF